MPKINVYLPDDLAEAVRETGIPVSAVCQRALEQAVRRVAAIRATTPGDLLGDDHAGRLAYFTARARSAVKRAVELARAEDAATVGTGHLLGGLLDEEGNLALRVLEVMELDTATIRRELAREATAGGTQANAEAAPDPGTGADAIRFSTAAANALELTASEALGLSHNYVGCEHLLLGLVAEPDGTAGRVLRALGAEQRATRRAVSAALVGYTHLRAQGAAALPGGGTGLGTGGGNGGAVKAITAVIQAQLQPVVARLDQLEARMDNLPGASGK